MFIGREKELEILEIKIDSKGFELDWSMDGEEFHSTILTVETNNFKRI